MENDIIQEEAQLANQIMIAEQAMIQGESQLAYMIYTAENAVNGQ